MFDQFAGGYQYPGVQPYGQYSAQQRLAQLQQQMQPQQSYSPAPQSLVRVTGIDGAKAYQMPPNSTAALFDANDDVFFVKSTDGAGFPTIRAFRFSPIESTQAAPEFVTRAEFEELKGMIVNGQQFVRESVPAATDTNVGTK